MPRRLFAYGTLELPDLIRALLGRVPHAQPARLPGYARFLLRGRPYPAIVAEPGAETAGVLYAGLRPEDLAILDRFESDLYERRSVRVHDGAAGVHAAEAYVLPSAHRHLLSDEAWDRERFSAVHLAEYRLHCARLRSLLQADLR